MFWGFGSQSYRMVLLIMLEHIKTDWESCRNISVSYQYSSEN